MATEVVYDTADWAQLLDEKYKYIFIKGGRKSGKSHEAANYVVNRSLQNPDLSIACIRQVQKAIKNSSKKIVEDKIRLFGVQSTYDIVQSEIRNKYGSGIFAFEGLQDHTADSIKSLENFKLAWVEEAHSIKTYSLKMLYPTIRGKGAQIVFTWNPDQPDDAIEKFAESYKDSPRALHIHVNYNQNPFLSDDDKESIEHDRIHNPLDFDWMYLGGYNTRSDVRIFHNWIVEECEPTFDDVCYYGLDFGFAKDPCALIRCWIRDRQIFVDYAEHGVGIEVDHMPAFLESVPDVKAHSVTADSARPEIISYLNRRGYRVKPSIKGADSVMTGIDFLRGFQIVVHPRCDLLQKELRLYSYQTDKAGEILGKKPEDKNNHCIDALRYAVECMITNRTGGGFRVL